jgi:hypothetical protein
MLRPTLMLLAIASAATGCDTGKIAVNSTSKILEKAQPSMKQEADYDMAARAIPAALKTVEGFHVAYPDNERLVAILAEGYCQYATGFIEDEWELAVIAKDYDQADYLARRATKAFLRCMGYGLEMLGKKWQEAILGNLAAVEALAQKAGKDQRDGIMWVANGLAGAINMNKDDVDMVKHLSKARMLFERVAAIDDKHPPKDPAKRALPHIALGLLNTALPAALGGKPEIGAEHFRKAEQITGGRFLLAKVLYARRYGVAVQKRDLFRKTLVEVLQTDPAIWPEQRLANEIAHRRARRYLKQEKEWF